MSRYAAGMDRRSFLITMGVLAAPLVGEAQPPGKVARLGYLGVNDLEQVRPLVEQLRAGLRELGWVDGQNIEIDFRWAEGRSDQLRRLAVDLVRLRVDVIIAPTTQAIQAAQMATREIPIVMIVPNDPVSNGFVASLARPGGNITGLTFDPDADIGGKHVALLVELVPRLSRIAALVNPLNRAHALMSETIRSAARSNGVQLHFLEARSPDQIDGALEAAMRGRPHAMLIQPDGLFYGQRKRIADFASRNRLPTIYPWRQGADAGGLMTYGANLGDNFHQAGRFVDRILKGTKPADLPVEQPTKFELVINMKTAKVLGLTIPPSLLLRADQVIQ